MNYNETVAAVNAVIAQYDMALTLRQIYYRLVAAGLIPNRRSAYNGLSAQLVKAREAGQVDERRIVDRSRSTIDRAFDSPTDFLEADVLEDAVPATGYYDTPEEWCDHAWLKLPDGRICDPTRFHFEGREPYIYIGPPGDCYDEDGVRHEAEMEELRARFFRPTPDLVAAFNALQNEQD